MTRPSRPWLLPVVCAVLGIAWVLWLAHEREPAGEQSAGTGAGDPIDAGESSCGSSAVNPPGPRPEARPAPVPPSGARVADTTPTMRAPLRYSWRSRLPLGRRLARSSTFGSPSIASQPIARIGVEVTYDPALLKGRTLEEIDYARRAEGERAFRIRRDKRRTGDARDGDESGARFPG